MTRLKNEMQKPLSKRSLEGLEVVIATHNPNKAVAFERFLKRCIFKSVLAKDLDLPEPEETGETFEENALLKANAAAEASGIPALADDSGFMVKALGGAPGIYSGRWAGIEHRNFEQAMERIWQEVNASKTPEDHRATFKCCLALCWPDGEHEFFIGETQGTLVWPPRGKKSLGYEPIFMPKGHLKTYGEMSEEEKDSVTHRAKAFQKFYHRYSPGI